MILKKIIKRYGTGGHIILPKSKLGHEAIVIYDDEVQQFKDTIRSAYLMNSAHDDQIARIDRELRDSINPRLALVERFLTSLRKKDKTGNEFLQEA